MAQNNSQAPIKKAGCILHGKDASGENAFVMPFSEGRFGHNDKFYVMPTGSIDKSDRDVLAGAMRETMEETGIDVAKLLGEEAIEKLRRGEDVTNLQSPGYPGVRIIKAEAKPYLHLPRSRTGIPKLTALFNIEIEGIESLAPHLKNPQNYPHPNIRTDQVGHSVEQRLASTGRPYPKFDDLLYWLREGVPKQAAWNRGLPMPKPLFEKRPGEKSLIETIEATFADDGKITTAEQLQELSERVPAKDFEPLMDQYAKIKEALADMGFTKGDLDTIKLDGRDAPLTFYQEGANIISARSYIKRCLDLMDDNRDYERSHGGASRYNMNKGFGVRLNDSHFAPILPFVETQDIYNAIRDYSQQRTSSVQNPILSWRNKYLKDRAHGDYGASRTA